MIGRYAHPLVDRLWSAALTYQFWLEIEEETLRAQMKLGVVPNNDEVRALLEALESLANTNINEELVARIQEREEITKHDVAAFLEVVRERVPHGQWLHFGLTSSDLVDTAQAIRFKQMQPILTEAVGGLVDALWVWTNNHTPMLGYTHGQPAEPTSMQVRAHHWLANVRYAGHTMVGQTANLRAMKLSGPVGTFAHNPPGVEVAVAVALGVYPLGTGASQILPRVALASWANSAGLVAAACAKIAMDMRLLNFQREVWWKPADGQVGSSAMAHKVNPIQAEKVTGLARAAQGYVSMLQPIDGWLERDIAHSSVERIAVPDLWHVVLHSIQTTTELLRTMELTHMVGMHLEDHANEAWTHKTTLDAIVDGHDYQQAREIALDHDVESYTLQDDARWFTRNYPGRPAFQRKKKP